MLNNWAPRLPGRHMTQNGDSTAFVWMVQQCSRVHHHRRHRPTPGPIEKLVYDSLDAKGPQSCPQIAAQLGLTAPQHYEMVRNAIYRLLEKTMIYRHQIGDGPIGNRRVVWGARKQL